MIHITKTMKIVLIVTLLAFAVCFVSLGVSVAIEVANNFSEPVNLGGGGGGGGKPTNQQPSTPAGNITSGVGEKTKIALPSMTLEKTYMSTSSSSAVIIPDDSKIIASQAAILVELSGNTSIVERNSDVKIYPASMTKVMTLIVACENIKDPTAKLKVTQEMVDYHRETGGSGMMGFEAGESITVEDALYLINYNSDTIACLLIAEHVAGSEAEFVKRMNQKARDLDLVNTNFVNCTGLYDNEHYTTCREMAAIMYAAINNSAARKIVTAYNEYIVDIYSNTTDEIERSVKAYSGWYSTRLNDNNWAGNGSDVKIYGGKTGYEDIPTSCFVTYAQNTETKVEYICVTVGRITKTSGNGVNNSQSTADTKKLYQDYAK